MAKPRFRMIRMPPGRRLLLLAGVLGGSDGRALRRSMGCGAQREGVS